MTVQWRSTWSRLILYCLLASYIIAMLLYSANATTADPNNDFSAAASLVTPPPSSQESLSSLIVCAVDGSIYTIDALTGMAKGYFGTGRPLVGSSSRSVVPGLDGSIYTLDDTNKVQVLPLTVQQVVQHPVQTCTGNECGVVTGTKHTFLYGLDPSTGRLEWTQQFGKTDPDEESSSKDVVILHREDYVVRHISTSTGEELWNVTLGHVSALDFSSTLWDNSKGDAPLLSGRRHDEKQKEPAASSAAIMPSIAFGSEGTTVTAMDEHDHILWRRKLNTVIASVYGVVGNDFVPVTVVETQKEQIEAQGHTALVPLIQPRHSHQQRDLYLELLWKEVKGMSAASGEGKMVVFQPPPKNYRTSAELNRLAQKATKQECQGIIAEGACYETPLLEAGQSKQHQQQPGGIYLTWDRLLVTVVLLGVGIRVLIAHNRRMWNAERQKASSSSPRKQQVPSDRLALQQRRELSLSEHSPRMVALDPTLGDRVASLPDLTAHFNTTSPAEKSKLWNLERLHLHRASTAPAGAVDTSTSSSSGQIDGIPFVKHSRYLSEFREIGPLGKGGFGTVFRCENVLDGRQYAIKKVRISSGDEFSQRLQRVLREIKSLAKLDHPNIVRYYTAWLEAEEDNGEKETDAMDGSNTSIGRCYSVELMTSNLQEETSDGRRPPTSPSVVNKKSLPPMYNDTANPLGWNGGISMDPSFDDKDQSVSQEGSDFGGFHFDRSSGSWDNADFEEEEEYSNESSSTLEGDNKEALLARSPGESTATPMFSNRRRSSIDLSSDSDKPSKSTESPSAPETKNVRHTLYIQMHLCSQKTLGDFLSNEGARRGTAVESMVDIPLALSLFHQIAEGVKHVHEQGLIHRDLKPSNCFIDDGVVKVGDFGLSRESSEPSASSEEPRDDWLGGGDAGEDFSAGIGTRAYASPEQQKGSNYDASTDVYSLGIMLFELCYPMCTVSFVNHVARLWPTSLLSSLLNIHALFIVYFLQGMERNIVFSRLRQREFPQDWQDTVAASFPIVHSLLASMLSPRSQDRPSAATVASRVESLLGEYTVLHLDRKGHEDGCTLLRVEAAAHEGVLPQTIQLIKDVAPNVVVEQYGLRGQDSKAIMEFALSITNDEDLLGHILSELRSSTGVHVARQISDSVSIKL